MARRHTTLSTEIGELTVVADGDALAGLYFPGHWHLPPESAYGELTAAADPVFAQTAHEIDEYLAGERHDFTIPTVTDGDAFSERVWALLAQIPYGQTVTYGALATELGNPRLAQRVGQCVGRNPISIVIPCHRVVGADGSLTGYAGGLDRKRRLLEIEETPEVRSSRLF